MKKFDMLWRSRVYYLPLHRQQTGIEQASNLPAQFPVDLSLSLSYVLNLALVGSPVFPLPLISPALPLYPYISIIWKQLREPLLSYTCHHIGQKSFSHSHTFNYPTQLTSMTMESATSSEMLQDWMMRLLPYETRFPSRGSIVITIYIIQVYHRLLTFQSVSLVLTSYTKLDILSEGPISVSPL